MADIENNFKTVAYIPPKQVLEDLIKTINGPSIISLNTNKPLSLIKIKYTIFVEKILFFTYIQLYIVRLALMLVNGNHHKKDNHQKIKSWNAKRVILN